MIGYRYFSHIDFSLRNVIGMKKGLANETYTLTLYSVLYESILGRCRQIPFRAF